MFFVHFYFIGCIIAFFLACIDAYLEEKLGSHIEELSGGICAAMGCSWFYIFASYKRIYKNYLIYKHRKKI